MEQDEKKKIKQQLKKLDSLLELFNGWIDDKEKSFDKLKGSEKGEMLCNDIYALGDIVYNIDIAKNIMEELIDE